MRHLRMLAVGVVLLLSAVGAPLLHQRVFAQGTWATVAPPPNPVTCQASGVAGLAAGWLYPRVAFENGELAWASPVWVSSPRSRADHLEPGDQGERE